MRALLVATVMFFSSSLAASAITINFIEGDAGTTATTNLGSCPGAAPPCVQGITQGSESASIDLIVPANFFAAPNAPPSGTATAFLLEPDSSKAISDILTLNFVAAENRLAIGFTSDAEDGAFGTVPSGFIFGLNEAGSAVETAFKFFTGTKENPTPYTGLPSGTSIMALSDLNVPEPCSLAVLGVALAGLAVLRRKSQERREGQSAA